MGAVAVVALSAAAMAQGASADTPYAAAVKADNPSGYWRLDEASGSCSPAAAAGSAGALSATNACSSTAGALDDAADADNGAQQLTAGYFSAPSSSAVAFTGAFTLEAWINTDTVGQQGIIEKYDVPSGFNGYGLRLDSTNHLMGFVCNATAAGNCSQLKTTDALPKNSWQHVALVVTGAVLKLYVNGKEVAAATQTQQATAGTATFKVGANGGDGSSRFHGALDEVAVYPTALDDSRIQAHYRAAGLATSPYSQAVTADSPSAYWRMSGADGDACTLPAAAGTAGQLTAWGTCSGGTGALRDSGDDNDASQQLASGTYFSAANTPSVAFTGAFTLEAWIKTDTTAQQGIIEKYDFPGGQNGYGLRLNSDNRLRGFVCNASAAGDCSDVTTSTAVSTGDWHLVQLVSTGSTLKIYLDGAEAASATQTQQITVGVNELMVGARGADAGTRFHGSLDEVALYPRALSAARVRAHYTAAGYASTPYTAAVVVDSPSGYWRLNEPSGSCAPSAFAGFAGPLVASDLCAGVSGALQDSGDASDGAQKLATSYFTAPSNRAVTLTGPFTLEAWIKTDAVGQQGIIEKYDPPSGYDGYGLRLDGSNHLMGFVCNATANGNCSTVTTSATVATGGWHLVQLVASGSTLKIYLDGAEAASATQTQQPTPGTSRLTVGSKAGDPTKSFQGSIDEVAVYQRALSAARVQAHYAAAS